MALASVRSMGICIALTGAEGDILFRVVSVLVCEGGRDGFMIEACGCGMTRRIGHGNGNGVSGPN